MLAKFLNKRQFVSVTLAVFASVAAVAIFAYGATTIGTNVSVDGNLTVSGTSATSTFSTGGLTVGTSQFVVQQTSGNVGIGTAGPVYKFEVMTGSARRIIFNEFSTNLPSIRSVDTVNNLRSLYLEGHDVRINTGDPSGSTATSRLTVDSTGNVGIGTTGPLSKLDVNGGVAVGSYAGANAAPSNGLIVSGNVGIGTTSPSVPLHVNGIFNTSAYVERQGFAQLQLFAGNAQAIVGTVNNYPLDFRTNSGAIAIEVSTSGNVIIGATGAVNKLDVNGAVAIGSYAGVTAPSNGMIISGNVGIGTTTPSSLLDVNGVLQVTRQTYIAPGGNGGLEFAYYISDSGGIISYNRQAGAYRSLAIDASTLLLNSGAGTGQVGIGTTSPAQLLSVAGDAYIAGAGTTTLNLKTTTASKGTCIEMFDSGGAVRRLYINAAGAITVEAGTCK